MGTQAQRGTSNHELTVLHLIDSLGAGGAERSLFEMLPRFDVFGIRSVICCRKHTKEGVEASVTPLYDVRFLDSGGLWSHAGKVRRIIRELRPDLVHTTLFASTLVGRLATVATDVPLLTSIVNVPYSAARLTHTPVRKGKVKVVQRLDRASARRTTHFHAITAAVKAEAQRALKIPAERITVIPRGRDEARLGARSAERRRSARSSLGLDGNQPVIVSVGRQEHQKGHRYVVEAMPAILAADPSTVLLLVGRDGYATPEIEAVMQRFGLGPPSVQRLGHRGDVPDLLSAADVLVFPSLFEGLGGTLIEAMALETPIVASDVPAIAEVLDGGRAGALVPPADPEALSDAVVALLADTARRASLVSAARQRFEVEYELDRVAARMVHLYERLARAGTSAGSNMAGESMDTEAG